jgi:ABC-type transport system involved in cytochrome bd biosynthesis fused ATPase/permease subunit
MFGILLALALAYCIVLLSLVFSVIERKQNTLAARELTSELSTLEANYANTVSSISDAKLAEHNYKRIDGATFAVRKDPIASYTVLYAR